VDAIRQSEEYSTNNNRPVFFYIDLTANTFWMEEEKQVTDDILPEEDDEITSVHTTLVFTKARNSFREVCEDTISFLLLPDGTKEFGLISILDPETEESYTLFINPYLSSPEIFTGEVDFNEYISF
jgi:hypothetical protein